MWRGESRGESMDERGDCRRLKYQSRLDFGFRLVPQVDDSERDRSPLSGGTNPTIDAHSRSHRDLIDAPSLRSITWMHSRRLSRVETYQVRAHLLRVVMSLGEWLARYQLQ